MIQSKSDCRDWRSAGVTIIMKTDFRWQALASIVLAVGVLLLPVRADAAGGAFAVDDAVVGNPGECKVESWASAACQS